MGDGYTNMVTGVNEKVTKTFGKFCRCSGAKFTDVGTTAVFRVSIFRSRTETKRRCRPHEKIIVRATYPAACIQRHDIISLVFIIRYYRLLRTATVKITTTVSIGIDNSFRNEMFKRRVISTCYCVRCRYGITLLVLRVKITRIYVVYSSRS